MYTINPSALKHAHTVLRWWIQFMNDAAYALANCGHSFTALLGFFPFAFAFSLEGGL
jgi:hypothetical protein